MPAGPRRFPIETQERPVPRRAYSRRQLTRQSGGADGAFGRDASRAVRDRRAGSGPAAWGRSTARGTPDSAATSPSRSSPTTSPPTPTAFAVSSSRPGPSPPSTTPTSSPSTTSASDERHPLRRHRAPRGGDAARSPHSPLPHAAPGPLLGRPGRPGPRRRSPQGHRPPRPQAREPLPHHGRPHQDPRLRPRQAHLRGRGLRGGDGLEPHEARRADGDGGLHVPRAGAGAAGGRAVGPLLLRSGALRASGAEAPLPARHGGGDADRDPARGALSALRPRCFDPARGGRDRAAVPGEGTGGALPGSPRPGARPGGGAPGADGLGLPAGGRGALAVPGAVELHGEGRRRLLRPRGRGEGAVGEDPLAAAARGDRPVGRRQDVLSSSRRHPPRAPRDGRFSSRRQAPPPSAVSARRWCRPSPATRRPCGQLAVASTTPTVAFDLVLPVATRARRRTARRRPVRGAVHPELAGRAGALRRPARPPRERGRRPRACCRCATTSSSAATSSRRSRRVFERPDAAPRADAGRPAPGARGARRKRGYRFEDEALVDEMVSNVEGVRGALPLLAFAVARLWEKRDREKKLLTREAYREIAGVEGALAQHAEATMDRIGPDRQGLVREIFRNLVTAQGTRAVVDREELLSAFPDRRGRRGRPARARRRAAADVVRGRGQGRASRATTGSRSCTSRCSRPGRASCGGRRRTRRGRVLRDQLKQAAHLWEEKGRTADLLWTGTAYREYELWRERYPGALTALEEDFARSMAEKARRKKRLVAPGRGRGVCGHHGGRHGHRHLPTEGRRCRVTLRSEPRSGPGRAAPRGGPDRGARLRDGQSRAGRLARSARVRHESARHGTSREGPGRVRGRVAPSERFQPRRTAGRIGRSFKGGARLARGRKRPGGPSRPRALHARIARVGVGVE